MTLDNEIYMKYICINKYTSDRYSPLLSIIKRNKEIDVRLFTYVALFIEIFFEIF